MRRRSYGGTDAEFDQRYANVMLNLVRDHSLAPEDELCGHIRANRYACPAPDDTALDRALDALYASLR